MIGRLVFCCGLKVAIVAPLDHEGKERERKTMKRLKTTNTHKIKMVKTDK